MQHLGMQKAAKALLDDLFGKTGGPANLSEYVPIMPLIVESPMPDVLESETPAKEAETATRGKRKSTYAKRKSRSVKRTSEDKTKRDRYRDRSPSVHHHKINSHRKCKCSCHAKHKIERQTEIAKPDFLL